MRSSWTSRHTFLAGLVVVVAIAAALFVIQRTNQVAAPASSFPLEIQPAEALKLREEGAFMLDVRQPDEYAAVHIPGVTLIPLGELSGRLSEVPEDQKIVVVCRSGNRSAQGRDLLLNAGYTQVTSMAGGMTDWSAAGYPTEAS